VQPRPPDPETGGTVGTESEAKAFGVEHGSTRMHSADVEHKRKAGELPSAMPRPTVAWCPNR
jgi:hypothetical protein